MAEECYKHKNPRFFPWVFILPFGWYFYVGIPKPLKRTKAVDESDARIACLALLDIPYERLVFLYRFSAMSRFFDWKDVHDNLCVRGNLLAPT